MAITEKMSARIATIVLLVWIEWVKGSHAGVVKDHERSIVAQ